MPAAAVLHLAIAIGFAVHAVRTGRPHFWIYILVFFPLLGAIIYFLAEVLPELMGSRSARRAAVSARQAIDPDRAYREARKALEISPTAHNMCALADACVARGRFDEAIGLYRRALTGISAGAPDILERLANAAFMAGDANLALQTLDELKTANPDYQSADAHLIYARALEALGRNDEALEEYAALTRTFSGEEARCRYAMLLHRLGRRDQADRLFAEILKQRELAPRHYVAAQREWIDIARGSIR